jgi:hypothetical protein
MNASISLRRNWEGKFAILLHPFVLVFSLLFIAFLRGLLCFFEKKQGKNVLPSVFVVFLMLLRSLFCDSPLLKLSSVSPSLFFHSFRPSFFFVLGRSLFLLLIPPGFFFVFFFLRSLIFSGFIVRECQAFETASILYSSNDS